MFEAEVPEKIKTNISYSITGFFLRNREAYEAM